MNKMIARATAATVGLLAPALTLAYDYNYDDYNYDYDYSSSGSDAAGAALGLGFLVFFFIFGIISLVCLGFVIWMIVDAAKRDFDQKIMWILLMVFLGFIPAVIYYFMIKRKNVTGSGKTATATPAAPQTPTMPKQ